MAVIMPDVKQVAHDLAAENARNEPEISRTYWFPADSEVRLVHVDPMTPPNRDGKLHPFYFGTAPQDNIPYRSAIALIRPEEDDSRLALPPGWGTWNDAEIWDWVSVK